MKTYIIITVAFVLISLAITGCDGKAAAVTKAEKADFWYQYRLNNFRTMKYAGHSYVLYSDGMNAAAMVHDPDCECKQHERK